MIWIIGFLEVWTWKIKGLLGNLRKPLGHDGKPIGHKFQPLLYPAPDGILVVSCRWIPMAPCTTWVRSAGPRHRFSMIKTATESSVGVAQGCWVGANRDMASNFFLGRDFFQRANTKSWLKWKLRGVLIFSKLPPLIWGRFPAWRIFFKRVDACSGVTQLSYF